MCGMAVATIVASIATMKVASMIVATTSVRLDCFDGADMMNLSGLSPRYGKTTVGWWGHCRLVGQRGVSAVFYAPADSR
jgi:hypothetical protein